MNNLLKWIKQFDKYKYITLDELVELEILHLSNINITAIPKELCNLVKLKQLYLNNNNITTIPKELGNLVNLEVLDLDDNYITTIPKELANLIKLNQLYLDDNNITLPFKNSFLDKYNVEYKVNKAMNTTMWRMLHNQDNSLTQTNKNDIIIESSSKEDIEWVHCYQ